MKMKLTYLTFILILLITECCGQMNKFPSGVYLNLEQLKSQTPAYDVNLKVIYRTSAGIAFSGGSDYKLESEIDSIRRKYLKTSIYAYVKNDSIFLNGIHHKLQTWYSLCLTSGNFLAFIGCLTNKEASNYAYLGGAIGAGIASGRRNLYVLSLRTGNVRELTKDYLVERLKGYPSLLENYNNESNQEAEEVLLKYINSLNQIVSPYEKTKD